MPSIEYRLQTSFLSKASCKRIQRPIWTLIKNKMGLAKSAPNSMCSHVKILGLRTIWQNQLAHHITELTMRLNKQNEVGLTTRLRVKEAQLNCMHISNILSNSCKLDYTRLKFNLAYKIIYEGKKLGFSFQESSSYEENLEISGISILSLLDEKEANRYRESNNMCIFILEQLITSSGNRLLTWQQVRHIRNCKRRGCKPLWFQHIEERVLDCIILRTLKEEYRIAEPNQNAIICSKLKISADKRKKEWIIFKKERSFEISKVIKKEYKYFVTEYWQIEVNNDTGNMLARKCEGCILGRHND